MKSLSLFLASSFQLTFVIGVRDMRFEVQPPEKTCSYFYGDRMPKYEGGLVNCSWYAPNACCKRTEVTSVFAQVEPIHSATRSCRNQLNYLMCFFCSPLQYLWFTNQKLRVCAEYCDELYQECRSAGVGTQTFGQMYANGSMFCEAQDFDVVEGATCFEFDPDVFGSAINTLPNVFLHSLLFLILFVLNFRM